MMAALANPPEPDDADEPDREPVARPLGTMATPPGLTGWGDNGP